MKEIYKPFEEIKKNKQLISKLEDSIIKLKSKIVDIELNDEIESKKEDYECYKQLLETTEEARADTITIIELIKEFL